MVKENKINCFETPGKASKNKVFHGFASHGFHWILSGLAIFTVISHGVEMFQRVITGCLGCPCIKEGFHRVVRRFQFLGDALFLAPAFPK